MKGDFEVFAHRDPTIAFDGAVTHARPDGRAEIELANGHRVTAVAAPQQSPVVRGERVRVELPIDQLTGWRFHRRPHLQTEMQ